jgi:hypothetical protein
MRIVVFAALFSSSAQVESVNFRTAIAAVFEVHVADFSAQRRSWMDIAGIVIAQRRVSIVDDVLRRVARQFT